MKKSRVILFFIDGLGIGERAEHNPLAKIEESFPLAHFAGETDAAVYSDGVMIPTDACLGIDGRPQSASGQTTILTGVNAPKHLGFHKQGYPNSKLREVISDHSVFLQLERHNIGPNVFANAYTAKFFEEPQRWKSATTCAVEAAQQVEFRTLDDLLAKNAVFHDFTNSVLRARDFDVELWTGAEAGKILAEISAKHRFTLYEYFITDKIGHDQDLNLARKVLPELAACVRTVVDEVDLDSTTVILTSDHGNIEDLSIRNHTLNQVPTIVWGRRSKEISVSIRDLADITPAIVRLLTEE